MTNILAMAPIDQERTERSLNRAILKRDKHVNQILILYNLSKTVKSDPSVVSIFLARKNDLETLMVDFRLDQEDIMEQMLELGRLDEFKNVHSKVETVVTEQYYCIQAVAGEVACGKSETVPKSGSHINLPKIALPHFNGDVINWRSFRDTFASLVHENPNLSNVERFHYLISSVSGAAIAVVRSVPLSGPNYEVAWNALHDRFDNTRLIIHAHLDKLFGFSPIHTESLSDLKNFLNTFQENTAAIEALGISDLSGFLLFYVASRVLDTTTKRLFEADQDTQDLPTLSDLLKFVQSRCRVLQNSACSTALVSSVKPKSSFSIKKGATIARSSFMLSSPNNPVVCPICRGAHYVYRCDKFRQMPTAQRLKFVQTNRICTNCLSSSHTSAKCSSKYTCRQCSGKHHSLLHLEQNEPKKSCDKAQHNNTSQSSSSASSPSTSDVPNNMPFVGTSSIVSSSVLSTALIRICDKFGNWIPVRALLDSGSQISAITHTCARQLGLIKRSSDIVVMGLSQRPIMQTKGITTCSIVPRNSVFPNWTCEPLILSQITGPMPAQPLDPGVRSTYASLELADPYFDKPGQIDFLLGVDVYHHIFSNGYQVRHTLGLPSAFETALGWIVVGSSSSFHTALPQVSLTMVPEPSIKQLLNRFWEVEEPIVRPDPFTEEEKCEELFRRTTRRDSTGRYIVSLPFKDDPNMLGESRTMALSRFFNLERKLQNEPDVYAEYRLFMDEYIRLGHMKLASTPGKYFIPHHAVVKYTNNTLKLRVVFDASARSSTGRSLNELLFIGPKLQCDIADLLLQSRTHKYMFTADICKMYRQINIVPSDCKYQHVLWRNDPAEPLREYALATVTYGVSSSPFQAIRVLHQLEMDEGENYPAVTGVLKNQIYVDDIITGADSIEEVVVVKHQIIDLLARGKLELKKWASNCSEVLQGIPENDQTLQLTLDPKNDSSVKILGLHWNPVTDRFSYHSDVTQIMPTKRTVLSTIAKMYDPLGALAPITFWAKWFLQTLWKGGYDWDSPIPDELSNAWHVFSSELPNVSKVQIMRHIPVAQGQETHLLGFADASLKGYAAVVYIKLSYATSPVSIHFVTAKSRVAPLKTGRLDETLSVPRLELCGALLLAQVLHRVQKTLSPKFNFSSIHAWTDSTVVLSWLTTSQVQFKAFVTNRLNKIADLVPSCQWHHVPSHLNPADCVSRGMYPNEAIAYELYWDGPPFLTEPEESWKPGHFNTISVPRHNEPHPESINIATVSCPTLPLFERFSSFTRMIRVTVYMCRFIKHSRKQPTFIGYIRSEEKADALTLIIKLTQREHFQQLFGMLSSPTTTVSPRSVARLSPFIDSDEIIRVGGRLRHADIPRECKCPILLPKSCVLTILLIRNLHVQHLHAGPLLVTSLLARHYWVLSSRSVIRHELFKCVVCTRQRASKPQPLMGDLPASRVCPSRPFSKVGVDYAGPFLIKEGKRRNASSVKCYLSIFVCMVVKAVHIEVVSDLSTATFLAAFQRFVSRRGIPSEVYSDCGTNFQGADKELRDLFNDPVAQEVLSGSTPCKWHFNPPAAPHFGGLWEAAVKSAKYHLRRVIGIQRLTFEEMCTLTNRIEAVLNSRPLTPQSSDPNDLQALTPGHFLIGCPLVAVPEPDNTSEPTNRLNRWQLLAQCCQSFWKRWASEYLITLQGRSKWHRRRPNIAVGDLVLVHSPNVPPTYWKMGRITAIHPGVDGIVRVTTVHTADGDYKRPVTKLAVLPIQDNS